MRGLSIDRVRRGIRHPRQTARRIGNDLSARGAFRFGNGRSPAPMLVVLALGNRCNLRCRMCPQWGEHGTSRTLSAEDASKELTLELLDSFITELAAIGPSVHLTGGETLLARDSMRIIEALKSHGLRVGLTTNGTLLADKAEQIVRLGVDEIVISVDGTEEIHDTIRGTKGAFAKAMAGIAAVETARRAANSTRPMITTQTTISSDNVGCLTDIVEYLFTTPADNIGIHHLEFCTPEVLESQHATFSREFGIATDSSWFGLPEAPGIDPYSLVEQVEAVKELARGTQRAGFTPDFTNDEIVSYYTDGGYLPKRLADRCLFPWKGLIVYPDGSMVACPNYTVGNVANDSLSKVWNGDAYRTLRQALKTRKVFPVCSRCCWLYFHST